MKNPFNKILNKWRKKSEPENRFASFGEKNPARKKEKRFKEVWIGLMAALLVTAIIMLVFFSTVSRVAQTGDNETETAVTEQREEQLRHPLTGEELKKKLKNYPQVFGVMVENSADAWPLVGIDEAFLVIEAPVEAGIPRFITFFSEDAETEKIGPVRSARPYYLDWNDELAAVYAHVGGSYQALDLIKYDYETIDLDQFYQSEYFYRQNGTRYAPHNVYTSAELLKSSLDELSLGKPDYQAWLFKSDEPIVPASAATSLAVDFAEGSTYDVKWQYDSENNDYVRYQGNSEMIMENGARVTADNVIAIATDIRTIDDEGRKSIVTVGQGDALLVQDGQNYLIRWKKEERTGRLKFYTPDGEEVLLNAGKTWIEIVSTLSQARTYQD